jgi:type II secretory pathway component PulC
MIVTRHVQQQTALGVCIVIAILVTLTTMYDIWQWHNDWLLIHYQPLSPVLAKTDHTSMMIDNIPNAHLFGKPIAKITEVPVSSLHLLVTGIVKVSHDRNINASKVYISTSRQPSKIYRVGDDVSAGVKIYNIVPDAVILENNGHFEKLPLQREKLQFKPLNKKEQI